LPYGLGPRRFFLLARGLLTLDFTLRGCKPFAFLTFSVLHCRQQTRLFFPPRNQLALRLGFRRCRAFGFLRNVRCWRHDRHRAIGARSAAFCDDGRRGNRGRRRRNGRGIRRRPRIEWRGFRNGRRELCGRIRG